MKTISLTVPMDYNALTRASDMLHGLAIDLKHDGAPTTSSEPTPEPVATATEQPAAPAPVVEAQPEAAAVFADPKPSAPGPSATQGQKGDHAPAVNDATTPNADTVATVTGQPAAPAPVEQVGSATTAVAATGAVDTAPAYTNPAVLVPWDARIHSGTPTKLAKKPNNWKKKRGVEDSLVAQVEAELIQAMQASPANPVEPTPAPAPAAETVVEAQPAPAAQAAAPAPAPAGGTTTFPALMAAITSKGIDQATVLAAVNKQGLQALPLLAARPDLIPAVALELGV